MKQPFGFKSRITLWAWTRRESCSCGTLKHLCAVTLLSSTNMWIWWPPTQIGAVYCVYGAQCIRSVLHTCRL